MGRVIFYNNRMWFDEPLRLGPLLLYQIGEAYINGYMPVDGHRQFCYEITFVVSGNCVNYTMDQQCTLSKGEVLVNNPSSLHGMEIAANAHLRYLFMGFDFDESHPDFELFREMREFYQKNNGYAVQNTRRLQEQFAVLLEELTAFEKMQPAMLYAMVMQILVSVYRDNINFYYHEKKTIPHESIEGHIVYDIVHYIDAHFLEIMHLQEVADALGYSYPYLARVFIKRMDVSIGDYYNHKRFEEATRMMQKNMNFTSIAEKLGYSTVSAFSKAFSGYYKMSPSIYKKRFLNDQAET